MQPIRIGTFEINRIADYQGPFFDPPDFFREFDHWQDFHASGADSAHALAFGDSILPVVKTGQALLVGDDYALDDGLWFEPYPGHTPGNVVIHARSGGERGCSSAMCCTIRC